MFCTLIETLFVSLCERHYTANGRKCKYNGPREV